MSISRVMLRGCDFAFELAFEPSPDSKRLRIRLNTLLDPVVEVGVLCLLRSMYKDGRFAMIPLTWRCVLIEVLSMQPGFPSKSTHQSAINSGTSAPR